ncbi:MAG: GNAT family N-acetyltransferase [Caldilineaceae bacterium]|nr:GNAT family N-acetyltransferase [Caldilineaceae bacterium]
MKSNPTITVRPATYADRAAIVAAEALSTPGLRYVDQVFDLFMDRTQGEFLVAELAGDVVACGKFTITPDGSAWLETLRVIPACQGLGIGKRFYEAFFALAHRDGISTMRMYTGTKNVVSKGLAERFGFRLAEAFTEARLPVAQATPTSEAIPFQPVTDPHRAYQLIGQHRDNWHDFLVMNRTFYKITPALCTWLTVAGQVYEEPASESIMVIGARFMPEEALHIGFFGGDVTKCLRFALQQGCAAGVPRLNCIFPAASFAVYDALLQADFHPLDATLIVMETHVPATT